LVFTGIAVARALVSVPAEVAPSGVTISVPDVAVNTSPVLQPLEPGSLERIVFIHYAMARARQRCFRLFQ